MLIVCTLAKALWDGADLPSFPPTLSVSIADINVPRPMQRMSWAGQASQDGTYLIGPE
jgi:hypothetical protein